MNLVLARWNSLEPIEAAAEALPCCGSQAWAAGLTAMRPFADEASLYTVSDTVWANLAEADWQEAFDSHPRIGQSHARKATAESLQWSEQEQQAAISPDAAAKIALAEGNLRYEQRFGRIFIVCASGRSAAEILAILDARMGNDEVTELQEAAEQQRQITQLRLRRWQGGE